MKPASFIENSSHQNASEFSPVSAKLPDWVFLFLSTPKRSLTVPITSIWHTYKLMMAAFDRLSYTDLECSITNRWIAGCDDTA